MRRVFVVSTVAIMLALLPFSALGAQSSRSGRVLDKDGVEYDRTNKLANAGAGVNRARGILPSSPRLAQGGLKFSF